MPWLKLKFCVGSAQAEQTAAVLESLGAQAVSFEDAGDEPLFDQPDQREEARLWHHTWVSGLFDANVTTETVTSRLSAELGAAPALSQEPVPDQDWERAWLEQWHPLHFGGDLWVCPSWCPPPQPQAINIILDPGLAFGTGTHATTALCLEWLARHYPRGLDVIDYGCGSGILAIAALKLGARRAFGVDIDERALDVSRENAACNHVADRYTALSPDALPVMQADLVIANILAGPLIALAPTLTGLVRSGGTLLLSGMLHSQVGEMHAHYAPGFNLEAREREEWALLVGTKRT